MTTNARILIIDDERPVLMTLEALLSRRGFEVAVAPTGAAGRQNLSQGKIDLVLLDLGLPDADGLELLKEIRADYPSVAVLVLTGQDSLSNAIESIKLGAFHFIGKPYAAEELLSLIQRALENRTISEEAKQLREEKAELTARLQVAESRLQPVFKSRRMSEIEDLLRRVAPSEANVLLTGESGVGKEVIANLVHSLSPRAAGPMVKLNCAAFPEHMIEGELFGYVKGAFTGATNDFPGLIEGSSGGTLFLDEIAEMPIELQTRFLRVLQEREYRRLGSTKNQQADFRLVAATNRDPRAAIAEGRFRQDLFYRINTFTIDVPPLRERPDDIPALAEKFSHDFAARMNKGNPGITAPAMDLLVQYPWPGNVRELQNAIEYGAVLSKDGLITPDLLPANLKLTPEVAMVAAAPPVSSVGNLESSMDLETRERQAILQALARTHGNKKEAARLLGIQRPTLYNKMKRFGIPLSAKSTADSGA